MEAMASMLAGCVGGIRMRGAPGVPEPVGGVVGCGGIDGLDHRGVGPRWWGNVAGERGGAEHVFHVKHVTAR